MYPWTDQVDHAQQIRRKVFGGYRGVPWKLSAWYRQGSFGYGYPESRYKRLAFLVSPFSHGRKHHLPGVRKGYDKICCIFFIPNYDVWFYLYTIFIITDRCYLCMGWFDFFGNCENINRLHRKPVKGIIYLTYKVFISKLFVYITIRLFAPT